MQTIIIALYATAVREMSESHDTTVVEKEKWKHCMGYRKRKREVEKEK